MTDPDPKAEAAERVRLAAEASNQVRELRYQAIDRARTHIEVREDVYQDPAAMQASLLAAIGSLSQALGILMTTQWPREEDYE